jgi:hypothetical protein
VGANVGVGRHRFELRLPLDWRRVLRTTGHLSISARFAALSTSGNASYTRSVTLTAARK